MNRSYIEFNGIKSSDLGIEIHNKLVFKTPMKRYGTIEVAGRDGYLYLDEEADEDISKDIYIDVISKKHAVNGGDGKNIFDMALAISKWLSVKGFKDFRYSMYPDFIFKAMVIDPYNIADTTRTTGRGVLRFIFKPTMYYDNYPEKEVVSGDNLKNIGGVISKPKIRIIPNGSSLEVFNNGKVWFRLKDLVAGEEITIDSELFKVFTKTQNANNKMLVNTPLFPELDLGNNNITFNGARIYIEPRWGEKTI